MPQDKMNQKANMLKRAEEADAKAKRYGLEAKAYSLSASRGKGIFGYDYSVGRDAANQVANMYEQEAESLRQRAMPKPNSRGQYEHEREAGDPNALKLSFEDWKKL